MALDKIMFTSTVQPTYQYIITSICSYYCHESTAQCEGEVIQ